MANPVTHLEKTIAGEVQPVTHLEHVIAEYGGGGGGGGFTPTTAQLAAMNSGITSEDVEQISTNKTNISLLETMNGAKNMLQYTLASLKSLNATNWSWTDNVATFQDGSTFTVNDDMSISINTTSTHTLISFKLTNAYPLNKGNTVLTGCPSGGGLYKYKISVANVGYDIGSGISVDNMTSNKAVSIEVSGNIAANVTFKPMIITDTVNNAGFPDYQPYAMSNAELTAAIQALQAQLANQ
jgi:hypothetical protein